MIVPVCKMSLMAILLLKSMNTQFRISMETRESTSQTDISFDVSISLTDMDIESASLAASASSMVSAACGSEPNGPITARF
jgi:hypothetical protein